MVRAFADWLPTLLGAAGVPLPRTLPPDGCGALATLRGERTVGASAVPGAPPRFWQWNRYTPVARCNAAVRDGDWKLVYPLLPETNRLLPADVALRRQLDRGELAHDQIVPPPGPDYSGLTALPPQLFNVAHDPSEADDRAARAPARVAAMTRALDSWFEQVEADRRAPAAAPRA